VRAKCEELLLVSGLEQL